ncbi:hypothetical protein CF327_g4843 [Tilletia walkeri]|nr:hypothetical protein CF327_g4843 [Tilletia walkeri]
MPSTTQSSAPRIPSEEVLGRTLEAYILKAHEEDEDAASTFLTPRNIRMYLIKHFNLGSEHALDIRKLFIKNTSREVVEHFRAGEPPIYPVSDSEHGSPPLPPAGSTKASNDTSADQAASRPKKTPPRYVHADDEDDDEEEDPRHLAAQQPRSARRTPTKAELQKRLKANALSPSSDEDEPPDDDVELSEDSVSEDDQPSFAQKSKKRKSTSSTSSSNSPSPPRQRQRRESSPPTSTARSKSKNVDQPAPQPDDISDDSMIDDVEEELQKRRKRGPKKGKATAKAGRGGKRASGTQAKVKMDRLTTLKKLCVSCGARKVWSTWFRSKGCAGDPDSDPDVERDQIKAVLELLESIGAYEGMSAKQAAKLKEDRELEKELADIGALNNKDESGEEDSPGPNTQPGPSRTMLSGKRVRKPSAMAMASAEYEDKISHNKPRSRAGAPGTDQSPSKRSQASTSGAVLDQDDDTASSVFEISDDEDEDDDMDGRRRRRRRPKNEVEEDFIVDDDENLGYEKKRGSRRVIDSEDEDEDEPRNDNRGGDDGSESEDSPANDQDEVSLHLSTQFDEKAHQDKGEIPRRKQKAGKFRDDLKSFASALNN